jgi:tetratricopeptide (TPR) repeat protein
VHRWLILIAVAAVAAAAGCRVVPGATPLGGSAGAVSAAGASREARDRAESLLRAGEVGRALDWLERACSEWPGDVQAHRLRQDLRIRRGELAAVLSEARRAARTRDDAPSWYLLGRLLPAGEAQRRAFQRASDRDASFGWGHYGMGIVQYRRRRLSAAAAGLELALARFDPAAAPRAREQTLLTLARVRDARLDAAGAVALLEAAEREFPRSPAALLVRASMADRDGNVKQAFALAERALALPGGAAGASARLERLLRIHGTPADYARVRKQLEAHPSPKSGSWQRLIARVALETGDLAYAQAAYGAALELGVAAPELAAERRLLAVRRGRPGSALEAERTLVPDRLALAPGNTRRARHVALYAACDAWAAAPGDPAARLAFATTALAAGWIEEGRWVAQQLADAEPTPDAIRARSVALLRKLEGYDALIERLRAGLDAGYRAARLGGSLVELEPFLRELGGWAAAHLPAPWNRDLSAGTRYIRFGLIGELIDPVPSPPGTPPAQICGLQRYFLEEWNHHLLIGRRNGQPPEATLLRVASWDPAARRALWGEAVTYGVLHGEARALESLREHQGSEIAGAAFSAGFYVELVSAGGTAHALQRLAAMEGEARRRAESVAPPSVEAAGTAMALFKDPALQAALLLRGGDGGAAAAAEHDAVHWHELAHVVDARRMLPLTKHPADVLRWLARSGFSLRRAEARLEEHAYWAELAHAADPHAVLASLLGFLPERNGAPPHSQAAYDLLDTLVRWAWREGGVDRRHVVLHQLLHWPPERLRAAARACAQQRGFEAAGG